MNYLLCKYILKTSKCMKFIYYKTNFNKKS